MIYERRARPSEQDRQIARFTESRQQRAQRLASKRVDPKVAEALKLLMIDLARRGGLARARALSPARRREIASRANAAKQAKRRRT